MHSRPCHHCESHGTLTTGRGDENGPSERGHACDACDGTGEVLAWCDCCCVEADVTRDAESGLLVCEACALLTNEAEAEAAE